MARQATYNELKNQIAKLQQQAEGLRQKEVTDVIQSIQQQMKNYNLSIDDLGIKIGRGRKPGSKNQAQQPNAQTQSASQSRSGQKANMDAKFRHPETGATWSGRGRMPKWISEAVKKGQDKKTFAIN
jgi:DNA-binding protein H-NS